MNSRFLNIILFLITLSAFGQKEFHVFPKNHDQTPGRASGDGSISNPWDLQSALLKTSDEVDGGDIIWLHEGTYNGRFVSKLESSNSKRITVGAFKNDRVVLNGNVKSKRNAVLEVKGGKVIFKNFEITFLGKFSRKQGEPGFQIVNGLVHIDGLKCRFENLRVYNNPGSGICSWKRTGGSEILFCKVFNNGYFSKVRGSGVGIYAHNQSDDIKRIANNFVFNNYYKGIQVWSASSGAGLEYLKNIDLINNVVFNNGLGAGVYVDNLIIASDDNKSVNIPKNIKVEGNVFYHNVNFNKATAYGDGASVTLGFNRKAPVELVSLTNNVIIGKNNGLRLLYTKSINLRNNVIYSGQVQLYKNAKDYIGLKGWKAANNRFYTRTAQPFRVIKLKQYSMEEWQDEMGIDKTSRAMPAKDFNMNKVLYLKAIPGKSSVYEVCVINAKGQSVNLDLSKKEIVKGTSFEIKNLATGKTIQKGKLGADLNIEIPSGTHNKTVTNFGVYEIAFDAEERERRRGLFNRLFGWLF